RAIDATRQRKAVVLCDPCGVESIRRVFRWFRCAQPPANFWDPFGVGVDLIGRLKTTNVARLLFLADADEEWMQARGFGCVEHGHRTRARCDDLAVGEPDPLALVLREQLVPARPV